MKVLMLTPRMDKNHPIFGFAHGWAAELAERLDHLDIIAFNVGETSLPENTSTYSAFSSTQAFKLLKLNKLLFSLVLGADIIFTHMYPWFPIAAKPYALLFRKPLVMWNTHGHVDLKKKIALKMVDRVVTASERSFNINTPKKVILGHGINTDIFRPTHHKKGNAFEIIGVGRVDKVKGYNVLIKALNLLVNKRNRNAKLKIVGPIYNKDYYQELQKIIKNLGLEERVTFTGPLPYSKIKEIYDTSCLYASASDTKSLDKTTLEAMACGIPVIVSNVAFLDIFDSEIQEKCYFGAGDYSTLADKIEHFMDNGERDLRRRLRNVVIENHGEEAFAEKLVGVLKSVVR